MLTIGSDRFADSTRIYQGVLGNVDARLIARLVQVDELGALGIVALAPSVRQASRPCR